MAELVTLNSQHKDVQNPYSRFIPTGDGRGKMGASILSYQLTYHMDTNAPYCGVSFLIFRLT